jgi:hypothetical protein
MGISEKWSITGCASMSFPITSPIQTAEGGFVDASNYYNSLNTGYKTPATVWKTRTTMCHTLDEYKIMTSTHQFGFEKAIEAEQKIWSNVSLRVCHVCDGCHLTKMRRKMVEF